MGSPSRNVQYHPPRLSEDRLNLPQPHSPTALLREIGNAPPAGPPTASARASRSGPPAPGAALLRRGVFALFMGLLPADASLQRSFRGDSNQASAYPRLSGGQPSLETVPNTVGLSPSGALPSGHSRGVLVRCRGKGGTCDGCDDRIRGTYIGRAANPRPVHRSAAPGRCPGRAGSARRHGC